MILNPRVRCMGGVFVLAMLVVLSSPAGASTSVGRIDRDYGHLPIRRITFPVLGGGANDFEDDFGDPRDGFAHKGQDIFGDKLTRLVAATDGTITNLLEATGPTGPGNMLEITASDGWKTLYMHINNDSPGTEDNANPAQYRFAPGIKLGVVVKAGDFIAYMGESGDAEPTPPHVHFEIRTPKNVSINPHPSLRLALGLTVGSRCRYDASPAASPSDASAAGFVELGATGVTYGYGEVRSQPAPAAMTGKQVSIAVQTSASYWAVSQNGEVSAFGAAPNFGSIDPVTTSASIVQIVASPTRQGYWLVAANAVVTPFGDARPLVAVSRPSSPVVSMAITPSGGGAWLASVDGTVTAIGDAPTVALVPSTSSPGVTNEATVGIAATSSGNGLVLLGTSGSVRAFGDGISYGSLDVATSGLCQPRDAVNITQTASGAGYWITSSDGAVWPFGDARTFGDVHGQFSNAVLPARIVGFAFAGADKATTGPPTVLVAGAASANTASNSPTFSHGVLGHLPKTYAVTSVLVVGGLGVVVAQRRRHGLPQRRWHRRGAKHSDGLPQPGGTGDRIRRSVRPRPRP